MAQVPVMQVLEKEHYFNQALVSLPGEVPYPPLEKPSTVRFRSKIFCITSNNFTYAGLGFMLGWWDAHRLPPSTPAPYNDAAKYGCTNAWGYAEVLDSTMPSVPKGSFLYGYLPLGTLAQEVECSEGNLPGEIVVTSAYRQKLMPVYNRYDVFRDPALAEAIRARANGPAYDAFFRPLFLTGHLMSHYMFPSDPTQTVHPGFDPSKPWTPEMADLTDATILLLAPGSKTALGFAWSLARDRTGAHPKRVVAVPSAASKPFVEACGLYKEVVTTDEAPLDVLARLGITSGEKVVLIDFGGRASVGTAWSAAIRTSHANFLCVSVGMPIAEVPQDVMMQSMTASAGASDVVSMNTDDLNNRAMAKFGAQKVKEQCLGSLETFKKEGVAGLRLVWGEGMEAVKEGWDRLAKGGVQADEGLVFMV